MSDKQRLAVLWDGERVGSLAPQRRGRVVFTYAPEWVATRNRPISLSLSCDAGSFDAQTSTAFFDNLLPEEAIYRDLCRAARIDEADIYNFLRLFGQECAGALTIVPEEETLQPALRYKDITNELEALLARHNGMPQPSLIAETQARLSIAGAQNKLPVLLDGERFLVPEEGSYAPTNAILKPTTARFADLHRNELFCMELARTIGLATPDARILHIGGYQAYLIMRYDRQQTEDGIRRIHQEDFCQALGVSRLRKYEENGGPGFSACNKVLLHPLVSGASQAREDFILCALFNFVIGNCDAHGKNFSLLYHPERGVCLAPFYDLVSTRAYPELDQKFAMAFGKTFRFDRIAEHSWKLFAADMTVRYEWLLSLAEKLLPLASAAEVLAEKHERQYGVSPIYETLVHTIKQGLKRLTEGITIGSQA